MFLAVHISNQSCYEFANLQRSQEFEGMILVPVRAPHFIIMELIDYCAEWQPTHD